MKIVKSSHELIYPVCQAQFVDEAKRIERVGRVAYKSEDKITKDSWKKFISMIIKRGHEAVLEHSLMTVLFICDRGVSHEIVRHRLCAFTQESTRYCNYALERFGNEITVIKPHFEIESDEQRWKKSIGESERAYLLMLNNKVSPQIARSVLPNSLKTEIGVSANFREWRHIFQLRAIEKAAHPQMREVMVPLYEECRKMLPEVFDLGDPES